MDIVKLLIFRPVETKDVICTDDDCIVTTVKSCRPVGYSDHFAIEFAMTQTPVERNVPDGSGDKCRYLWHIGDYD